ncbi:GntR family transcriptional regulator YhfZ [Oceanobacillus manasiensis]|uniref:GntR family transcriptional regulator YhfZ n=1 Tax=Oceanobacillus manasiensis TaxID=586413 RepID=UPI0005AA21FA|nr:GntR family transcriptional regulator YhfZ [Oceanobacillus manasiensis]
MSRILEGLYSKNGLAAKEIASKMMLIREGERIPRVSDFAEEFSIGNGTVQGALKVLDNIHAIKLEARGHMGTYLLKKDLHLLKEIAGVGSFIGAMPLPYSTKYEGLATGLIEASEAMMNRIDLAYMRGSKQRLDALKTRRYDFIIMSQLAAEEEMDINRNLEIAVNFGPQTYVTTHQIFFANKQNDRILDGMRVGVDYTSIDQSKITLLECEGLEVDLVPVNYMQLFDMLMSGDIDAAVWNADENRTKGEMGVGTFRSSQAKSISVKATSSIILVEKARQDVKNYLERLDVNEIVETQKKVVRKEKLPHY